MRKHTRRDFLKGTALTGAGIWLAGSAGCTGPKSGLPAAQAHRAKGTYKKNAKLNVAGVGCGGKGHSDIVKCHSENVVALCDVDFTRMAGAIKRFPNARKYHDWRVMLDELWKDIDAITCSTTDHMHAPISVTAMRMGKHVYCQKPLTHDVWEARVMATVAKEHNVATQMGNQGMALDDYRTAVETLQAGTIGNVTEAHFWTDRPIWPQGVRRPAGSDAIPEDLDWDLWIGTAPMRPYKKDFYHPFAWRGWWDFGTGALGDIACHTLPVAFMGLDLKSPTTVEAECSGFDRDSFPTWSIITYQFPARGKLPALKLVWYDGGARTPQHALDKLKGLTQGEPYGRNGVVLVGDKGTLYRHLDRDVTTALLPRKNFEDWKPGPQKYPRLGDDEKECDQHHTDEWIAACKDPKKTCLSDFQFAGPLTEAVLLGNVALYVGKKIEWDGANGKVTNCPEANALLRRHYRKGWEVPGLG